MKLTFIQLILQILGKLFPFFQSADKPKKKWQPYLDPDAFESALDFFKTNIFSYLDCKIAWKGGKVNRQKYNCIMVAKRGRAYYKVYSRYIKKFRRAYFVTIHREEINEREYNLFKGASVTWCNQAASLFSYEYCGFELDYFSKDGDPTELNANTIATKLARGEYNTRSRFFREVDPTQAMAVARDGGLAIATQHKPKTKGHIAIVDPYSYEDGKIQFIQAGKYTGVGISFSSAFGKSAKGKVRYWVYEELSNG